MVRVYLHNMFISSPQLLLYDIVYLMFATTPAIVLFDSVFTVQASPPLPFVSFAFPVVRSRCIGVFSHPSRYYGPLPFVSTALLLPFVESGGNFFPLKWSVYQVRARPLGFPSGPLVLSPPS